MRIKFAKIVKSLFCIIFCITAFSCQERIFIEPEAGFEKLADCYILKNCELSADYFILENSEWKTVLQDCDRCGNFKLFFIPQDGYYRLSAVLGADTIFAGDHYLSAFESFDKLKIVMLDVKQGDSFVIFPPTGNASVIDGGYGSAGNEDWAGGGEKILFNYLQYQGIDSLTYIFESHHHADHYGGLDDIIAGGIRYKSYLDPNLNPTTQVNDTLSLSGSAKAVILHADPSQENPNNQSLVLKLLYGSFDMLFTGDIEQIAESDIISDLQDSSLLNCEVLKAAHHGSSSSSSADFLDLVKAQSVFISVGLNNPYHHPTEPTLDRLKNNSEHICRTDLDGDVTVYTDGTAYQVVK